MTIKPVHWTYEVIDSENEDLFQGDIIQPNEDVRLIFEKVHKHFIDPKYSAFLVLTQTCDLVRRNEEQCKARYINLAVIRPLEYVLLSYLDIIPDYFI